MLTTLTVTGTEQVAAEMLRVHFSAPPGTFAESHNTDRYLKLVFPPADGPAMYPQDTNLRELRASAPPEQQPRVRTYSVRLLDAQAGTLAVDFVIHPGPSVAAAWAQQATAGVQLQVAGPGGHFRPDPEAHNLFVADPAGLPAALAGIEALPAGAVATLVAEVPTAAHVPPWSHCCSLTTDIAFTDEPAPAAPASGAVTATPTAAASLAERVRALPWPDGRVRVFAHGEAEEMMTRLRPYLRERGVAREDLSVSGYWRRGCDEDAFQRRKRLDAAAEREGKSGRVD